ncbi:GGDEF domain-containing protein [Kineococcus rhizosphaerae]|uniref:PAS domain S-box-containing protein/diguanylate cyclase (GGDEF)-like protein n=1 Tax=Kineococcus rhizosphaerae TaxID=559628 RepID=A0A2T0R9Z5_9ACTN|nr:GGDEF domain-containing protein [Kineococcus rhizosphaerae]PRY17986.1 PAS domain S-box-containing protein/diguanylate cyclase (GGDEF)-like protein [Kineococcus rhizosphaerae]
MTPAAATAVVAAMRVNQQSQVFALDVGGAVVDVPASLALPAERAVVPPAHRVTIAHFVDPRDLEQVLRLWETALADGVGTGVVRAPGTTEQFALAVADARSEHGCLLASLTPLGVAAPDRLAGRTVTKVAGELRPRTATLTKSPQALITAVSPRAEALLGFPADALLGHRSTEFLHPDDITTSLDAWMEMLATGTAYRSRVRHRRPDGGWLWIEVLHQPVPGPDGSVVVHADVTDISTEMAALEELRRREQLFRRTLEALPVGLLRLDVTGRVVQVNARFGALLGSAPDLPAGAGLGERLSGCGPDCRRRVLDAVDACLDGGGDGRVQVCVGGDEWSGGQHCSIDVTRLGDDDGEPGVVLVVQDVTEAVRSQRLLARRATTDALTGCLNRSAALAALEADLAADPGPERSPAVVFLDLDGFKGVNDRLGHAVGDGLLVRAGAILRETVAGWAGGADVCRLGGDEFLVVLHRSPDERSVQSLAEELCARLRTGLEAGADLAGHHPLPVGASAGAARAVPGDTTGTLVARADAAMYVAKRAGRRADWSDPAR